VYQDMILEDDIACQSISLSVKETVEQFLVKKLQDSSNEEAHFVASASGKDRKAREYSIPFRKVLPRTKLCTFFAKGQCKHGLKCRFFHGPQTTQTAQTTASTKGRYDSKSTFVARRRNNRCQMQGCTAFCKID